MMKRLLALVLVLALTLSNLPAAALAAELEELTAQETVEETVEETAAESTEEEPSGEEIPEEVPTETEAIPEETQEIPEETGAAPEESDVLDMVTADYGLYSPAFTFHSAYPVSYFNKITEFEADPDEENVFYLRYYPDPYMEGTAWAETVPGTFVARYPELCTWELAYQDQYESVYKITLNELGNERVDGMGIGDTWEFIVWHDGIVHWEQDDTWMQKQFNAAGHLYITNKDATETVVTPPIPVVPPETEPSEPGDSEHPAYLTVSWLGNDGQGWYQQEGDYDGFRVMPGQEVYLIFLLNYWDGEQYVKMPTHVKPVNGDLNLELIGAENAAPGVSGGEYFYRVTTGTWDQHIDLAAAQDEAVGGVMAHTDRNEICIYDSAVMSNETCVTGPYIYDLTLGNGNEIYVGFDNDYWTVTGFYNDYNWCAIHDTDDPNMKRLYFSGDTEKLLAQGYEDYFAIKATATGENGEYGEFYVNFTLAPDYSTIPHDPYLTFGYLENWGEGWFDPGEWHDNESTNICPGDQYSMIFFLHLWDEEQGCFVEQPVPVSQLKSNGVDFALVEDIREGEANANCFALVTPRESAFRQDVEIYVTHEGQKVSLRDVTVDLHQLALYTSPDIGYESLLRAPLEIDPFGENAVYLGFYDPSGEMEVVNVGLTEFEDCKEPLAAIEQVKDNVWKITATEYAVDWTASNYLRYVELWAECGNPQDDWTWMNYAGFDLSRMELEVQAAFELDREFYEVIEGGYVHTWNTGEVDGGHDIWTGEYVTELPEGVGYAPETNTLTLDNYQGESFYVSYRNENYETGEVWYNLPSDTLTVELIGRNSLVSEKSEAMAFAGGLNVVFTGDGSLNLKSTNSPDNIGYEDRPVYFHTLYADQGSLTFQGNVNVTVEIAGTGLQECWGENGSIMGTRPAQLAALFVENSEIYIRDNATVTTVVPEGGKLNGPTLPEGDSQIFWDDRNPGGYAGLTGFNSLNVSGGTLNTSELWLNGGYFENEDDYFGDNSFHGTSFYLSGGTVNINALGSYASWEQWQWNEETQEEEYLGTVDALHYWGLEAGMGAYIEISGGRLNIDVDPSEAYEDIQADFTGMQLYGTDMVISGGEVSFLPGYNGTMMRLESMDYNEEIYFTSYLVMNGGKLNFNGKDDCRVNAMEMDGRCGALLNGGTITADNADFRMGGSVVFAGTELKGIHLDYYSDGELTFNSGLLSLHEESSVMMGMGEMNGGTWDLSEAGVYVHGGFHFNDGQITIVNEGEEIFWPGLIVETYFAMKGDAELELVQNGVAPAMEVRGTFHQMEDSTVTIRHQSSVGEAALFVPAGDETQGTLLLNDGKFQISAWGEEPVLGLRLDPQSMSEFGEGEMHLTNADAEFGGKVVMHENTFTMDGGKVFLQDHTDMTLENADFRLNTRRERLEGDEEWYIAFLASVKTNFTVNGGSLTIDTQGYDCAFDLCGDYLQTGGTVTVNGDNMAMAVKGISQIKDGTLNLKGVTGYSQNYEPEITENSGLTISGGNVNIDAVQIGMELTTLTEISGGNVNITVSGSEIEIRDENGNYNGLLLLGRGILVYPAGPEASLTISGGEHSITVPTEEAGYLDSGLQAIMASECRVELLGGTLRTNSLHGIVSNSENGDYRFRLGEGMAAYDLGSGKELIPVDHLLCSDENDQPVPPEEAIYTRYIRFFEMDNEPGDVITLEGVEWAGNLEITARKEVSGTVSSDAEQLLPGKKATLTAEGFDPEAKLVWTLAEGDKDYVTLKVGKDNTATVTAKKNKQLRQVTVSVSDGIATASVVLTVIPVVSGVDICMEDGTVLNGQTIVFYMNWFDTTTLGAVCEPAEAAQSVTWKSSDAKSVSVDENGVVTLLKPGKTVTITATATDGSGKKATFKIKTAIAAESLELSGSGVCAVGKTVTLKAKVLPENTTSKNVAWYIVDDGQLVTKNAFASISGGKLKGIAPGKVTVRAVWVDWEDVYAEWSVDIKEAAKKVDILDFFGNVLTKQTVELYMSSTAMGVVNAPVSLNVRTEPGVDKPMVGKLDAGEEIFIYETLLTDEILWGRTNQGWVSMDYVTVLSESSATVQLDALVGPEGAAQEVTWKSSNVKYATVSPDGLVTALVPGKTVTITATAADGTNKSATVKIKTVQPVEQITLSGSSVAAAGKTVSLRADIQPANATSKKLVWSIVEGSEYASISNGKLKVGKKISGGETVTVRAQWADDVKGGAVYDEWVVTLYADPAKKVVITDTEGAALTGTQTLLMSAAGENTLALEAAIQPETAAREVLWKSSNEKFATVDEYGVVTVLEPGKIVTITATAADGSGKKATVKVKGVQPVENLSLAEDLLVDEEGNLFVAGGKSLKLAPNVKIFPANASNKKLTWSVEENGYGIKISSSGVLSTNAKKITEMVTVTVTAVAADKYGSQISFDVNVYPATTKVRLWYEDVEVTGRKDITAWAGFNFQLTANSDPEGAAQVYTWKSSNEKYATVDADGVVTLSDAVGKTVTITATAADGSGKKATVKIKIVEAEELTPIA